MVYLQYLLLVDFSLENVGKHISPMDPMDIATLFVDLSTARGPLQAISVSFEMQSVPPRKKSGHQDHYIVSRGSLLTLTSHWHPGRGSISRHNI